MHEGLADSSAPERLRGILVLKVFRTQGRRQFCAVWDTHSAWSEPKEEPEPAEETEKEKPHWSLCSRVRGTIQETVPTGGRQGLSN